jgi:hypothetical protein
LRAPRRKASFGVHGGIENNLGFLLFDSLHVSGELAARRVHRIRTIDRANFQPIVLPGIEEARGTIPLCKRDVEGFDLPQLLSITALRCGIASMGTGRPGTLRAALFRAKVCFPPSTVMVVRHGPRWFTKRFDRNALVICF